MRTVTYVHMYKYLEYTAGCECFDRRGTLLLAHFPHQFLLTTQVKNCYRALCTKAQHHKIDVQCKDEACPQTGEVIPLLVIIDTKAKTPVHVGKTNYRAMIPYADPRILVLGPALWLQMLMGLAKLGMQIDIMLQRSFQNNTDQVKQAGFWANGTMSNFYAPNVDADTVVAQLEFCQVHLQQNLSTPDYCSSSTQLGLGKAASILHARKQNLGYQDIPRTEAIPHLSWPTSLRTALSTLGCNQHNIEDPGTFMSNVPQPRFKFRMQPQLLHQHPPPCKQLPLTWLNHHSTYPWCFFNAPNTSPQVLPAFPPQASWSNILSRMQKSQLQQCFEHYGFKMNYKWRRGSGPVGVKVRMCGAANAIQSIEEQAQEAGIPWQQVSKISLSVTKWVCNEEQEMDNVAVEGDGLLSGNAHEYLMTYTLILTFKLPWSGGLGFRRFGRMGAEIGPPA
ncbi:hypothetical protein M427DRAFT_44473 [Gonapodya prolifera JEL478]|uniref:Uncharacterized protein n=1 Tax=Gonapodya prolifera (strain JEL478) TaxID=1344416 RepID=A0A139AEZ2_GONPJ|nr:hypothetical protein M427DRAFT_44473 [Gonapodya prolifera JEL478]|eukprot:KXS15386.1 hypothetical protein M427DRAFT_44473 [Gonapodya prolifera JEL478]